MTPPLNHPSQHAKGFTLVELMVALALGLVLILVVTSLYLSTAANSRTTRLMAQMNEDGALALEILQEQLQLAGFSTQAPTGARQFTGLALRACDGGFTSATERGAFDNLTCNAAATAPDALAIRYEATVLNTSAVTDNGGVVRPSNCSATGILAMAVPSGTPAALADNRFFIAPDAQNGNTPTLYCRGSDGPNSFSPSAALIPNIEDLQLTFAITRLPVTGEVIPHQVTAHVAAGHAALAVAAGWPRVAAVHVCLLARTATPIPTGDNSAADFNRYLDCDGVVRMAADGRARRAYRTTVYLRNTRPGLPAAFNNSDGTAKNPYSHLSNDGS